MKDATSNVVRDMSRAEVICDVSNAPSTVWSSLHDVHNVKAHRVVVCLFPRGSSYLNATDGMAIIKCDIRAITGDHFTFAYIKLIYQC